MESDTFKITAINDDTGTKETLLAFFGLKNIEINNAVLAYDPQICPSYRGVHNAKRIIGWVPNRGDPCPRHISVEQNGARRGYSVVSIERVYQEDESVL